MSTIVINDALKSDSIPKECVLDSQLFGWCLDYLECIRSVQEKYASVRYGLSEPMIYSDIVERWNTSQNTVKENEKKLQEEKRRIEEEERRKRIEAEERKRIEEEERKKSVLQVKKQKSKNGMSDELLALIEKQKKDKEAEDKQKALKEERRLKREEELLKKREEEKRIAEEEKKKRLEAEERKRIEEEERRKRIEEEERRKRLEDASKLKKVPSKQQEIYTTQSPFINAFNSLRFAERDRLAKLMKEAEQLKKRYAGIIDNLMQKLAKSEAILDKATQQLDKWLCRDETFKEILLVNRSVSINNYYSVGSLLNIVTAVEEQDTLHGRLIVTKQESFCSHCDFEQSTVSVMVALKNTNIASAVSFPMKIRIDTTCTELYSVIYHVFVSEFIIKEGITFQLFNGGKLIPKDIKLITPRLVCDGEYGLPTISVRILYASDFDVDLLPPNPFCIDDSNCTILFFGDIPNTRIIQLDMTEMPQLKCLQVFNQLRRKRLNVEKLRIYCITILFCL